VLNRRRNRTFVRYAMSGRLNLRIRHGQATVASAPRIAADRLSSIGEQCWRPYAAGRGSARRRIVTRHGSYRLDKMTALAMKGIGSKRLTHRPTRRQINASGGAEIHKMA
jgi:hypothetical protein